MRLACAGACLRERHPRQSGMRSGHAAWLIRKRSFSPTLDFANRTKPNRQASDSGTHRKQRISDINRQLTHPRNQGKKKGITVNKKLSQTTVYTLLLSLIVGLASVTAVAQTLYVDGIDAAFPPFSFINAQGEAEGFDVDVVRWIGEEMGFDVQIVPVDWDAIVPTLKLGTIDLIASGMTITQERLEQVAFTDPYWSIELAVVVRQTTDSNGELIGEKNLFTAMQPGERVGVQRGTTSQSWLEENVVANGIDVEIVLYDNFLLALDDLEIGRVSSAVMDEPTALSAIEGRTLAVAGTIATGEIYGYAVRKADTELLSLLNEGLSRIQASPVWDELVAEWLVGR